MEIWGAGIAGLLAGVTFPTANIFEAGPENSTNHKALLRFRSSAVGDAVGIGFRKVRVHKGIWTPTDGYVEPSIRLANLYSLKVNEVLADRSIWNLEPVDRFIAPEDFIEQLIERCHGRIHWDHPVNPAYEFSARKDVGIAKWRANAVISTLPMSMLVAPGTDSGIETDGAIFAFKGITVARFRVKGADVFQTVYYPDPDLGIYRASITKDLLIIESVRSEITEHEIKTVAISFGLKWAQVDPIGSYSQKFGKIANINNDLRRSIIYRLTSDYNIFSVGRFATWRNILLDDVLHDLTVVKKMLVGSEYDRRKINSK